MSIFSSNSPGETMAVRGDCKRDFEQEIAARQKQLKSSVQLKTAIEEYIDQHGRYYSDNPMSLPEMFGRLVLEIRKDEEAIDLLKAAWEKEIEREKK